MAVLLVKILEMGMAGAGALSFQRVAVKPEVAPALTA
jgi:hypothetical protein